MLAEKARARKPWPGTAMRPRRGEAYTARASLVRAQNDHGGAD